MALLVETLIGVALCLLLLVHIDVCPHLPNSSFFTLQVTGWRASGGTADEEILLALKPEEKVAMLSGSYLSHSWRLMKVRRRKKAFKEASNVFKGFHSFFRKLVLQLAHELWLRLEFFSHSAEQYNHIVAPFFIQVRVTSCKRNKIAFQFWQLWRNFSTSKRHLGRKQDGPLGKIFSFTGGFEHIFSRSSAISGSTPPMTPNFIPASISLTCCCALNILSTRKTATVNF